MRRRTATTVLALLAPLLPLGLGSPAGALEADDARANAGPRLRVTTVQGGLAIPWDVQPAPGGRLLVSERDRARISVLHRGRRHTLADLSELVWVSGETGLMSLALAPDFRSSRLLYACHGARDAEGRPEVRVSRWRVSRSWQAAKARRTVLGGLPATSGRHGGCRLLFDRRDGALLVGTGDAAVGANPRDPDSLGGKVLRVDPASGGPRADNPWATATSARRWVWTFGHRNVQGLAQRRDGTLWSVEHGSWRDDEVNLLVRKGDYGWNPVPGYEESVPMTDHALPGRQRSARWSSGEPTLATSGAAWVRGKAWGRLRGTLAVAALEGSRLLFLRFDRDGRFRSLRAPRALRAYGRLRSVTVAPGGALLVTTSNGDDDRVLRVTPR